MQAVVDLNNSWFTLFYCLTTLLVQKERVQDFLTLFQWFYSKLRVFVRQASLHISLVAIRLLLLLFENQFTSKPYEERTRVLLYAVLCAFCHSLAMTDLRWNEIKFQLLFVRLISQFLNSSNSNYCASVTQHHHILKNCNFTDQSRQPVPVGMRKFDH